MTPRSHNKQIIQIQELIILNMRQALVAIFDAMQAKTSQDRERHLGNANRFSLKVDELTAVLDKLRQ